MAGTSNAFQTKLRHGLNHAQKEIIELREMLVLRRRERTYRELKYQFAVLRFEAALIRHAYVSEKAGFKPDQPRWPKDSGGLGGRWSGGAGTEEPGTEPASPRPRGHHLVPGEIYRNESLRPETRRVFEGETIGPLRAQSHNNSDGHVEYNKAVQEAFDRFKSENSIAQSEDMTPAQARKFVVEVRGSIDPRIRQFNMRIIMRELRFYIRRGRGAE
jgi:hypothetical protein